LKSVHPRFALAFAFAFLAREWLKLKGYKYFESMGPNKKKQIKMPNTKNIDAFCRNRNRQ
jgi:hypothetical protein